MSELSWWAIRTMAKNADMAAKVLRRDGIVAVLKTERRLRRRNKWDKERRYLTYNAAPGYVWIATPAGHDPRCFVRPLHIFQSFVGLHGMPVELPGPQIRRFLDLEEGPLPGYLRYHRTGREFRLGDTVIVNTGPFRDHQVKVENIEDGEVVFFVRMLGKDQEVRLSVDDVIKAEAA